MKNKAPRQLDNCPTVLFARMLNLKWRRQSSCESVRFREPRNGGGGKQLSITDLPEVVPSIVKLPSPALRPGSEKVQLDLHSERSPGLINPGAVLINAVLDQKAVS